MDGLLQHRQVLQAGRIIKKAFGDTAASAVRTETTFHLLSRHDNRDNNPGGKEKTLSSCKLSTQTLHSRGGTVLKR